MSGHKGTLYSFGRWQNTVVGRLLTFALVFCLVCPPAFADHHQSKTEVDETTTSQTGYGEGTVGSVWLPIGAEPENEPEENRLTPAKLHNVMQRLSTQPIPTIRIYTSAEKYAQARTLKAQLDLHKLKSEIHVIPARIQAKIREGVSRPSISKWIKQYYVKPTRQERYLGITAGIYSVIVQTSIWFSVGLDPVTVATLVGFRTTLATGFGIYGRTFDNVMSHRTGESALATLVDPLPLNTPAAPIDPNEPRWNQFTRLFKELTRRQLYSLVMTNIIRAITGPVGSAHGVLTGLGQAELFTNTVINGSGSSLLSYLRNGKLSRVGSIWTGFYTFVLLATIGLADLAGIHGPSWDIGFYHLTTSQIAMVAGSLGLSLSIFTHGKQWEALSQRSNIVLDKTGEYLDKKFAQAKTGCLNLFQKLLGH